MILYINRETEEIVGEVMISPRPGEERPLAELAQNLEIIEPPASPVQAFLVTDEQLIAKYREALETWSVVQPVYDQSGKKLLDLEIKEPDFGLDRI
jgi:hypothetical protein